MYSRKLHIYRRHSDPIQTDGNAAGDTQSSSLSQQSNNQVMQSQPNILKDIISDRTVITKTNYFFYLNNTK